MENISPKLGIVLGLQRAARDSDRMCIAIATEPGSLKMQSTATQVVGAAVLQREERPPLNGNFEGPAGDAHPGIGGVLLLVPLPSR